MKYVLFGSKRIRFEFNDGYAQAVCKTKAAPQQRQPVYMSGSLANDCVTWIYIASESTAQRHVDRADLQQYSDLMIVSD